MRRPSLILILAVLSAATLIIGAAWTTRALLQKHVAQADELDWLRTEFRLSDVELAKVRALHESYLPLCASFCNRIAELQEELKQVLARDGVESPAVEAKLAAIGALRAKCQAEMLKHFASVSRVMPREQGQRYLAEMERSTIGAHEHFEQTMSGGAANP